MKTILKKTLLIALPLVGMLLTAPAAFARPHHHHHYHWGYRYDCPPRYDRGWYDRGRYDDYYSRPGWYGGRRYYDDDDYYRSRYPRSFSSDPLWWYNFSYR